MDEVVLKIAREAEDVGLLKPSIRKKMGVEMASIFEEVGRSALEKAMTRSVSAVAEEVVAFSDELAKRVKDTLGAKGVKDAVAFIPAWAESVATRALNHAHANVTNAILSGMKQHFPIGQEGEEKQASSIIYKGALYIESLSNEPYQRAMERIDSLRANGKDPVAGTIARIKTTQDPGKIQGIFRAAKEQASKYKKEDWAKVMSAASAKFKEITGGSQRIG